MAKKMDNRMKRNVILLIILIQICTGCINDIPTDCEGIDPNATYMSFRSSQITLPSDATGVESITIESVRIMVFSKTNAQIVTNQSFPVGNLSTATYDTNTNEWRIDFSHIVVETKPGESIVYVVLNENIMSVSGQTLSGALNMIGNLSEMQTLVNTPLSYTVPLKVVYGTNGKPIEPPFIMSTFDEFDIQKGRTYESPYLADLRGISDPPKGFELDRTMAKVTIDSISSYPIHLSNGDTTITDNKETSFIFILKMGLINVPMQYLWSPNRLQPTPPNPNPYTVPVPPYNLPPYDASIGYQEIDFNLENTTTGYYDRTWKGNVKLNFTANTYQSQRAKKSEIWYTGIANGIDSYSLNKYKLDSLYRAGVQQSKSIYSTDTVDVNSGNFSTFVKAVYKSTNPGDYLPSTYNITNANITPNIKGAYWTLKEKNISYYVPEHILETPTSSANATKLHIKAAKASVSMPDSIVEGGFTLTKETWNITSQTDTEGWIYSIEAGGQNIFALNGDAFTKFMRSLYGQIEDVVRQADGTPYLDKNGNQVKIIRHYWNGIMRYRNGNIEGIIENSGFQDITTSKDTMNFYLPIGNPDPSGPPYDYNIYRNHEYKFSVHALEQWDPVVTVGVSGTRSATDNMGGDNFVLRLNDK